MPIHAFLGKPGAGKSYHGTKQAKEAVEAGRHVVTNLPLKVEHEVWQNAIEKGLLTLYTSSKRATPDNTEHFGRYHPWRHLQDNPQEYFTKNPNASKGEAEMLGPLVIVDECSSTFRWMLQNKKPSQVNQSPEYPKFIDFLEHHRHTLADIILLYQDHTQIDGGIKPLIEYFHKYINMEDTLGKGFFRVLTSTKGFITSSKQAESKDGRYDQKIFELYDTHAEGGGAGTTGKEGKKGLRRLRPVWLRPSGLLLIGSVVFLPLIGWNAYKAIKGVVRLDEDKGASAMFAGGGASVSARAQAQQVELVQVERPKRTKTERADGLPAPELVLVGFDSDALYFEGGRKYELKALLKASDFTVLIAEQCEVILSRAEPPELVTYRCRDGF